MMVILHDNGGVVENYIVRERQMHGSRIVIDGPCRSACTVYLANPGTCATPRASFGFHAAFVGQDLGRGKFVYVAPDPVDTAALFSMYPPGVKAWIQKMRPHGLGADVIVLKGQAMLKLVPRCRR